MIVKATQAGVHGNKRIKEGEIFELKDLKVEKKDIKTDKLIETITIKAETQFSKNWMEKVSEAEAKEDFKSNPKKKMVKPDLNDNEEVI